MSKTMCMINVVGCNSSPEVITPGGHRQMHGATLLFWPTVPWLARHSHLKVQHSTKQDDVWEECHDASLLA